MYYNTYSTEESINNKVRYQYITSVDYEKDNSRNLTYPMLLHQSPPPVSVASYVYIYCQLRS